MNISKISVLAHHTREILVGMMLVAIVVTLTACGGASSSASPSQPTGNNPPPQNPGPSDTVTGVATPTSVAVVTATNAQ